MIYKKCVMTIDKNKAALDEDIYLYRLDKNIELYFTIVNNKYRFNKGDMNNIILITNASFFQVRLYKNAEIKYTFAIQPTDGGQAILTITDDLIDDPIEVGDYDFQISLLDEEKTSMISMPIVSKQLHVCEPLVSDDATMGKAILGLSKLATGEIKNAFDSEGNYIREIHKDGDILSAELINKFEEALDTNTKAIKNGTGTSYDDTEIKTDINTIKTDLGTEELTTTAKDIKGAVNEVAAQYKDIANYSLVKHTDGKVYIKKQDGTLMGTGIEIGGSDVDLSKITMTMSGQTLKLMNDGIQIASVEIPTAVVTDEQLTSIIQSKIDDGTLNALTIEDGTVGKSKIKLEDDNTDWNLLKITDMKYEKNINQYGNVDGKNKSVIWEKIPVTVGKKYMYKYTVNSNRDYQFVNSKGFVISNPGLGTPVEGTDYCLTTEAPSSAVGITINFNIENTGVEDLFLCEEGNRGILGKIKPKWLDAKNEIEIDKYYYKNLFNPATVDVGQFTNNDSNGFNTYQTTIVTSDYIEIEPYNYYTLSKTPKQYTVGALFDKDKNFLTVLDTMTENLISYTIFIYRGDAKYIRISTPKEHINKCIFVKGKEIKEKTGAETLDFVSNIKAPNLFIEQPVQRFKGKTVIVTGDSITEKNATATKAWHEYLADWLGFTVYNDGKSGTGLYKSYQGASGLKDRIEQNWETTYPTNPDIILLHGFMNDGTSGYISYNNKQWYYLPIGSKDDEAGVNSVYGQLKSVIALLEEKYPLAKLGFICSTPRSQNAASQWSTAAEPQEVKCYGHGWFERYIEAYKYLCEEHNIPFLDLYHNSPLKPWITENAAHYFKEANTGELGNVHPNAEGHLHGIAYPVYEWLKKYF